MSEPHWKKLEAEMLQFELEKPTSSLKQKCLSRPVPSTTFLSWYTLATVAILLIVASWSSYENFIQQQDTTSIRYSLQHRLDTQNLSQQKKISTMFVKSKNTYTLGESRAKWLQ